MFKDVFRFTRFSEVIRVGKIGESGAVWTSSLLMDLLLGQFDEQAASNQPKDHFLQTDPRQDSPYSICL